MHDKNRSTDINEQSQALGENNSSTSQDSATHCFYQLSGELMSKPKALCDVIEAEGRPATLVFCNLPSDTDMVEAVLNRNGIAATKIIGNVPPTRVSKAIKATQSGEITAIVVTDIGARNLEVEDVDLVINYSIPDDPEIYLHRIGNSGLGGRLHKIVSFVNPLDISNFHYLRKLVGFSFQEMTLPTPQEMSAAKLRSLRKRAEAGPHLLPEHIAEFARQLAKQEGDTKLLALLLYNTMELLPQLQASATDSREDRPEENGSDRFERGGYRQSRDQRSSYQSNSNSRGRYNNSNRGSSNYKDRRPRGTDEDYRSERDDNRSERYSRRPNNLVTISETRLYLGLGSQHGFSEDTFKAILNEKCPEASDKLQRFSLRKCYAFADFPEEIVSAGLIEKLREARLEDGSRLTAISATKITSTREKTDGDEQTTPGSAINESTKQGDTDFAEPELDRSEE